MHTSDLYDMLEYFEGLSLVPYLCPAGVPTIGFGCTFYEDGTPVSMSDDRITFERAIELKENVMRGFRTQIVKLLNKPYTDFQLDAMISLAYNIGIAGFKKSSVRRYFNEGNNQKAANSFLLWNKVKGKVSKGLVRRRKAERLMFLGKRWEDFENET